MPGTSRRADPYSIHPGVATEKKAVAGLKDRTGRTLEEWLALIRKSGPRDQRSRAAWLKETHKLGTNYAKWLAGRAEGSSLADYDPAVLVDAMYTGPKAALRPIHERLLSMALTLGNDVTVTPCATIVPIRRKHVIAQIKPATNTRIDVGFALKDTKPSGRLIDTGGYAKKDRITHRIPISSVDDIDDEILRWLKKAYEMDA
jgi:uncharacterized protein DUF5655/uncharacterized protein DUF4287